jgi:hypothetical protein
MKGATNKVVKFKDTLPNFRRMVEELEINGVEIDKDNIRETYDNYNFTFNGNKGQFPKLTKNPKGFAKFIVKIDEMNKKIK